MRGDGSGGAGGAGDGIGVSREEGGGQADLEQVLKPPGGIGTDEVGHHVRIDGGEIERAGAGGTGDDFLLEIAGDGTEGRLGEGGLGGALSREKDGGDEERGQLARNGVESGTKTARYEGESFHA